MYRFSTSLPYLLAQAGVRMGELFSRELARDGLTLPMYRVLAALAEQGTPQRLGELAALTSVEASTLSRLLGNMQRMGLVTRERPETNQRSLAVDLAPGGIALAARLIPRAAHYEATATGDLSGQEAALLKAMLLRVDANLAHLQRELDQLAPGAAQVGTRGGLPGPGASVQGTKRMGDPILAFAGGTGGPAAAVAVAEHDGAGMRAERPARNGRRQR